MTIYLFFRYSKILTKGISNCEQLLKVVSRSHDPPEGIVETYLRLYTDQNLGQLQKILELKGLKRAEQVVVIDLFQKKIGTQIVPLESSSNTSQLPNNSSKSRIVKDKDSAVSMPYMQPPQETDKEKTKFQEGKRLSTLFSLGKRH